MNKKTLLFVFFLGSFFIRGQNTSKEIKAILNYEQKEDYINVKGFAHNLTSINESFKYVFSIFKTSLKKQKTKKNKEHFFVINPEEKKLLIDESIQVSETDRLIILLLIYDVDNNLIAKDRKVVLEGIDQVKKNVDKDIFLTGLVLENTRTKPGKDFYEYFFSEYNLQNINSNRNIEIKEILSLGRNTKIEITLGYDKVFEFFVRPSEDYLKEKATQAVSVIVRKIQQVKNTSIQSFQY